jgi:hypothetical protein
MMDLYPKLTMRYAGDTHMDITEHHAVLETRDCPGYRLSLSRGSTFGSLDGILCSDASSAACAWSEQVTNKQ